MMDSVPSKRGRSDLVGERFFEEIEKALDAAPFQELRQHANKMLLHAADGFSRGNTPDTGITLSDVWNCHQAILKVTNRLSIAIGGPNIGAVPTPQYDVLEGWNARFAPSDALEELRETWNNDNEERHQWCQELFKT